MDTITEPATAVRGGRGFWGALWAGTRATVGALMGLAPHVMHHIGFLAGAAFLTGFLGNSLLYVVGLLLSIPLLRVPRQVVGRISSCSKVGTVALARPRWTSRGRFHAIAS